MIRALLALCLVVAAFAGDAPPANPHQASLISGDKTFPVVFVFSETMEGIDFALEKPDNPRTQVGHGKYSKVIYADPNDVPWLKGRNAQNKGEFAEAANLFAQAANSRESWYTRSSGGLLAAECLVEAGKADEAIKALDALLTAFPKSVDQARISYARGRALTKKGDAAGALKVYAELAKHGSDWGNEAAALGALGQAALLAADKKNAEAAAVLAPLFARLDPAKDARFAEVGGELARQLSLAGQAEPGIATLRRLAYGSPEPNDRALAHIAWAKALAAAGDPKSLFSAFDHAAIAIGIRQTDGAVVNQAAALAGAIVGKIDKLSPDQCASDLKAEYRRYLQR